MASKRTNFLFWSDRLDVYMVIPPIESVSCSLHLRHTPPITSTTLALEKHGSDMDGTIMNRPVRIFHASPRVQDHIHVLSSPNGPSIAVTRAHLARHDDAFILLARPRPTTSLYHLVQQLFQETTCYNFCFLPLGCSPEHVLCHPL